MRGKTSTGVDRRMGGRTMRVRDGQRGEYGFVESLTLLSQRLNARGCDSGGEGVALL